MRTYQNAWDVCGALELLVQVGLRGSWSRWESDPWGVKEIDRHKRRQIIVFLLSFNHCVLQPTTFSRTPLDFWDVTFRPSRPIPLRAWQDEWRRIVSRRLWRVDRMVESSAQIGPDPRYPTTRSIHACMAICVREVIRQAVVLLTCKRMWWVAVVMTFFE